MTILFGIELEGFYTTANGEIKPPPVTYPTDGFPGLVELRTLGGSDLFTAFGSLMAQALKTPDVDFTTCSHTFSREDRAVLRRRHIEKRACDIRNLYEKAPRNIGNKTIASVQLNLSNQRRPEYRCDKGVLHSASYGVLDVPAIVRSLDKEFSREIKLSGRQPGEYSMKDGIRLEYRSLPNFCLRLTEQGGREFIDRVTQALKEFI